MKLYDAGLSPNALRVRAVAAELGIAFDEVIPVNLRDPVAKETRLGHVNPNRKVPVLVDGDFVLWESRAIIAYLAGLRPEAGLYPADLRQRAIVDQWVFWQAVHLGPAMQRLNFERVLKPRFGRGEPDEVAIAPQAKEVAQLLPVLEAALAEKDWVAGSLSLADFALGSTFMYRDLAGIGLQALPNTAGWIARLEARPSWQSAAAPVRAFIAG
jgi:glutathione S-transferase